MKKTLKTNAHEVLEDRNKRMDIQKTFKDRISNFPGSHAKFCDEIGIAYSTMSRLLNLTYAAGWPTINRVISGFEKHGI